jgi:hypothetical protein
MFPEPVCMSVVRELEGRGIKFFTDDQRRDTSCLKDKNWSLKEC